MSLLCSWFDDWGRAIKNGLGQTWLIILIVAFTFVAMLLLQSILRASINKTKFKIKWGQIFLLIIFVLFIVWFCFLI